MNAGPPKNKLQVHYRILLPGETETVWVVGTSPGETVQESRPAWQCLSRFQWFPAGFDGDLLNSVIMEELRRSHPTAIKVLIDRITVLKLG